MGKAGEQKPLTAEGVEDVGERNEEEAEVPVRGLVVGEVDGVAVFSGEAVVSGMDGAAAALVDGGELLRVWELEMPRTAPDGLRRPGLPFPRNMELESFRPS